MDVINIQPHERWNYDLNQPPKTQMIRNLRQRCLPILSSASSLTSFPPHSFFVGLICDVLGLAILRTELWFRGNAKRTRDFGFLQWPQSELLAL